MTFVKKFLGWIDFARGSKTKVMGAFTLLAVLSNLIWPEAGFTAEGLWDYAALLLDQGEILGGIIGTVYGATMKIARKVTAS